MKAVYCWGSSAVSDVLKDSGFALFLCHAFRKSLWGSKHMLEAKVLWVRQLIGLIPPSEILEMPSLKGQLSHNRVVAIFQAQPCSFQVSVLQHSVSPSWMPPEVDCSVNVITRGIWFILNCMCIAPSLFWISTDTLLLLSGFWYIEQASIFVVLPCLGLFVPAFSNVVGCSIWKGSCYC